MTAQRANQRALAASRIVENLAYALPAYRAELLDLINHTVGYPDHTPGASLPDAGPTVILQGRCEADMTCSECSHGHDALILLRREIDDPLKRDPDPDPPGPVNCGHLRPCPHHDDPVTLHRPEGAAAQRERWRAELADSEQVITTITLLARDLLDRARRTVPLEPLTVPRCDATGMDGYLIPRADGGWSDLACTNPRSRGTLCDACSQRDLRWRKARGMTARPDGVQAHPAGTEADVAEYVRYGLRRDP